MKISAIINLFMNIAVDKKEKQNFFDNEERGKENHQQAKVINLYQKEVPVVQPAKVIPLFM